MNKKLRILFLLLSCCVLTVAKAEDVVFVFADMGFINAQEVTDVPLGDVNLTFSKAEGQNAPAYYTKGAAIRVYKNNTVKFASSNASKKITKVVMTFDSSNKPLSNVDYGISLSISDNVATWEGEEESFTLINRPADTSKLWFTKIVVTLSGGGSSEVYPEVSSLTDLKALDSGTRAHWHGSPWVATILATSSMPMMPTPRRPTYVITPRLFVSTISYPTIQDGTPIPVVPLSAGCWANTR